MKEEIVTEQYVGTVELKVKLILLTQARKNQEEAWRDYQDLIQQGPVLEARVRFDELKAATGQLEDEVRELTIEAYQKTGNKQPAEGVGIRVIRKLHYDVNEALVWCKTNFLSALQLNVKTFEQYALTAGRPDFVTIEEIPQATIAKEL